MDYVKLGCGLGKLGCVLDLEEEGVCVEEIKGEFELCVWDVVIGEDLLELGCRIVVK